MVVMERLRREATLDHIHSAEDAGRVEIAMKTVAMRKAMAAAECVPIPMPARLPYRATIPIEEIRRIVRKVVAERKTRDAQQGGRGH